MPVAWYNEKLRDVALHGEKAFEQNNMYELNVWREWATWRPPAKVCVSWRGIFTHHEIDQ